MKQDLHDIAVIGLGVMGQNLARNLASRKIKTMVYNRHAEKAEKYINEFGNAYLNYRTSLSELCTLLKSPRKIILMVPAGQAVNETIAQLVPYLTHGDIVIDGGNSYYKNSIHRYEDLKKMGIQFIGMGISGGEEGALNGPSLMPGGDKASYKAIESVLKKIAAKDFKKEPCVSYIGQSGSGHYVKMVHNGIEYAVMQMMAEAYHLLREGYHLSADEIGDVFRQYQKGKLKSYLFQIASDVFYKKDDFIPPEGADPNPRRKRGKNDVLPNLIDLILDKAGQKGTGRWVAIDALEHGAVLPTITLAVYERGISAFKEDRVTLGKEFNRKTAKPSLPLKKAIPLLEGALFAGMISAYAQGFELIRITAAENKWDINFAELARIWQGGCIIRADLLKVLHKAFISNQGKPIHLFKIKAIQTVLKENLKSWRDVAILAIQTGVPMPASISALEYFESMTSGALPANLIQGLRDYFGAHTYERTDRLGMFHTEWNN